MTRTRVGASPADIAHYIHDIWGNIIAETDGGGATGATGTVREYIYMPEAEIAPTMGSRTVVDRPVAVVDAVNTATPVTWFVHVDHQHRPIKMTNAAKAVVWDAVWLPWGGVHSITGSATLDARFPGQWFQLETGLHYNWHRSYDPTLGRYTQPDPLGFVDGPSVYGYVSGGPQAEIDTDGRSRNSRGRNGSGNTSTTIQLPGAPTLPAIPAGHRVVPSMSSPGGSFPSPLLTPAGPQCTIFSPYGPQKPQFPGWNPTIAPPGFQWRGGPQGSYYNDTTRESVRPGLGHRPPVEPHWDYNIRGPGGSGYRIYPDGRVEPK
jgi:RHS repeat-associated protein